MIVASSALVCVWVEVVDKGDLGELISGVLAVDHRDVVVVLVFLLQLVRQLLSNQIDDMKCFG